MPLALAGELAADADDLRMDHGLLSFLWLRSGWLVGELGGGAEGHEGARHLVVEGPALPVQQAHEEADAQNGPREDAAQGAEEGPAEVQRHALPVHHDEAAQPLAQGGVEAAALKEAEIEQVPRDGQQGKEPVGNGGAQDQGEEDLVQEKGADPGSHGAHLSICHV